MTAGPRSEDPSGSVNGGNRASVRNGILRLPGPVIDPARFVGRAALLNALVTSSGSFLLLGGQKTGRTSTLLELWRLLPRLQGGTPLAFCHYIPLKRQALATAADVFDRLVESLLGHCASHQMENIYVPTPEERRDESGVLKMLDGLAARHLELPVFVLVDDLMAFAIDEEEFGRLTKGLREILSYHPAGMIVEVTVAATVDFLSAESHHSAKLRDVLEQVVLEPWGIEDISTLIQKAGPSRFGDVDSSWLAQGVMDNTAGHPFLTKALLRQVLREQASGSSIDVALASAAAGSEMQRHAQDLLEIGLAQLDGEAQSLLFRLCQVRKQMPLRRGDRGVDQLIAAGFLNCCESDTSCTTNRILLEPLRQKRTVPWASGRHPRSGSPQGVAKVLGAYMREQLSVRATQTQGEGSDHFHAVEEILDDSGFMVEPLLATADCPIARCYLLVEHDVRVVALCIASVRDLESASESLRTKSSLQHELHTVYVIEDASEDPALRDAEHSLAQPGDIVVVASTREAGGVKWFLKR